MKNYLKRAHETGVIKTTGFLNNASISEMNEAIKDEMELENKISEIVKTRNKKALTKEEIEKIIEKKEHELRKEIKEKIISYLKQLNTEYIYELIIEVKGPFEIMEGIANIAAVAINRWSYIDIVWIENNKNEIIKIRKEELSIDVSAIETRKEIWSDDEDDEMTLNESDNEGAEITLKNDSAHEGYKKETTKYKKEFMEIIEEKASNTNKVIIWFMNQEENSIVKAKYEDIMKELKVKRRSVYNAIKILKERGLIKKIGQYKYLIGG